MLSVNVFVTFTFFSNILQSTQGWPFPRSETYTNKICRCIDSLAQAVKFYGNKYRSLIIDSLLGLAILRDSIGYICRTELLPPYIIKRVCKLSALINNSFDAMSDYILSHKLGFLSMLEWKANTYMGNTMYVSESPTSTLRLSIALLKLYPRRKTKIVWLNWPMGRKLAVLYLKFARKCFLEEYVAIFS